MAPNSTSGERRPATARRSPGSAGTAGRSRVPGRVNPQGTRPASRGYDRYDDMDEPTPRRRPVRPQSGDISGDYDREQRPRTRRAASPRSDGRAYGEGRPHSDSRSYGETGSRMDGRAYSEGRPRSEGRVHREGSSRDPELQRPRRAPAREQVYRDEAVMSHSTHSGGHGKGRQSDYYPDDFDDDFSGGRKSKRSGKKSKKTLILFGVEIIVIVILLGFIYFVRQTSKVEKIRINEEAITIEMNQNVSANEIMKGYRNIALFGVDSREGSLGKGTRSDTIIIASINQDTGDVRLLSVFRDTYLNLGNDNYNKCNAAYAQGGPEQAVIMLNKNLDMDITDYITVGFDGLIEVIDALGGVEINVTEAEIPHLNNYQISMVGTSTDGINFTANAGKDYTPVQSPGLQTLNGLQATAYCRIRYIGNDFQRAQRQRDVITAISQKAKKASVTQLNGVVNGVMDNISTSLDINEILDVASDLTKYNVVGSDGFPFEENRDTGRVGGKGDCVIPVDLKSNVVQLHEFLFKETDYQVSPEIEAYSEKVASDTGKRK